MVAKMAAPEEGDREVASALSSDGGDVAAQGPVAPAGAAWVPQPFLNRPAPVVAVGQAGTGRPGAAPPGRKAASEPASSASQATPASSCPGHVGPSPPVARESGLLAPLLPPFSTRRFSSASPSAEPPVPSALHNAAQQLQDVARQVALQQGKSEAAAPTVAGPPARLLPPQQLETIFVQVPDQTKENERPALSFATVQSQNIAMAQPVEKNAKMSGSNPRVIRIQPLSGTGSHQLFLHSSSGPTIQLLLQRPLHPRGQISADKIMTQQISSEQRNKTPTHTPNIILASTNPANSVGNSEKKQREQKLKKPLKVKTRSGRISRPPKYKAKDYKFIKNEDLADCHQSDSDDYSELSIEEDEEGMENGMPSLFGLLNCDLRPKLFKCQTCEKSYIGSGGLARHYKLNPDHRLQEPSPSSPVNRLCEMTLLEDNRKANGESSHQTPVPQQVTVTLTSEKADSTESGQQSGIGGEKRVFAAQQNDISLLRLGPGRPRQRRRRGRPRNTERSRRSGRFSRPGQFRSRSLNMSAEQHSVFRRKARLKELIQQCANEDFMDLVAPRFTAFLTVFEFLLMKVKKGYPAKTLFPDIYREFEELHAMVMRMCQEYFSNPGIKEPVEIKNPKVAESLGMNCNLSGAWDIQAGCSPEHIKTLDEHICIEASGQKRAAESSHEMLQLAKRSREASLLENMNDYLNYHGVKETVATNEDMNCVANTCYGSKLAKEEQESLELEATKDCANPDLCQPKQAGLQNLQLSGTLGLDHCPTCLFSCDEMQPHVTAENLQETFMKANSSWNSARRPRGSEFGNSLASEDSSQNPDLSVHEENNLNKKYQDQQEENEDSPINKKVEQPKDTDNVDELEKYHPSNSMIIAHPFETITERATPV